MSPLIAAALGFALGVALTCAAALLYGLSALDGVSRAQVEAMKAELYVLRNKKG